MTNPSLTPILIQEMTEDAINPIWAEAKGWYETRALYSDGPERDEHSYSDTTCKLKKFVQRVPFACKVFTGWVYLSDFFIIATISSYVIYINSLPLESAAILSVLLCSFVIGMLLTAIIGAIDAGRFDSRWIVKSKPFSPSAFMMYFWNRRRLRKHEYTLAEKLNICGDFLNYYAHMELFDAKERMEANQVRYNKELEKLDSIRDSLTTFKTEDQSALQAANATLRETRKGTAEQFSRAKEENTARISAALKQNQLGDAFRALSHVVTIKPLGITSQSTSTLMNEKVIEETQRSIESMSGILSGAEEEIDFARQKA